MERVTRVATDRELELERHVLDLIRVGAIVAKRSDTYRRRAFMMLQVLREERRRRESDKDFSLWIVDELKEACEALGLSTKTSLGELSRAMAEHVRSCKGGK